MWETQICNIYTGYAAFFYNLHVIFVSIMKSSPFNIDCMWKKCKSYFWFWFHLTIALFLTIFQRFLIFAKHFCLTLFRMGEGGRAKPPPTSFSPVTSTNLGINTQNLLTFSYNTFARLL